MDIGIKQGFEREKEIARNRANILTHGRLRLKKKGRCVLYVLWGVGGDWGSAGLRVSNRVFILTVTKGLWLG